MSEASAIENFQGGPEAQVEAPEVEESSEEGAEAAQEKPTEVKAAEVKARIKKLKLKYNGREIEEELPFEIDDNPEAIEYMRKQLQMSRLGQTKAQEYADLEKEIQQFVNDLRSNPKKVLTDKRLGLDFKKLVEEYVDEELQNAQKSPEQLEKERLEQRLKELEEERENEKKSAAERERERLTEEHFNKYNNDLDSALKASNLPRNPFIVGKIADYMKQAISAGYDAQMADVVKVVEDEMVEDLRHMVEAMSPEMIDKFFSGGYDKVRKHRMSKTKKPAAAPAATQPKGKDVGAVAAKKEEKAGEKRNFKEYFQL